MTDPRHLWRTLIAYQCECCGEPIVVDKSPGIGYYCGDCLPHFGAAEDLGRPSARFATAEGYRAWADADHERIVRRGQGYPHARSIPDVKFLAAVHLAQMGEAQRMGVVGRARLSWATRWGVHAALCGYDLLDPSVDSWWPKLTEDDERLVPWKVVRAKHKRLVRRGLVDGCVGCGCRGDYELTDKGRAVLAQAGTDNLTPGACRMSEIVEAPSATQSAKPAPVKVPGPVNCTTDDPTWNVSHLVVSNLLDGSGLTICGQTLAVADHPSKHVDCTCTPDWPRCQGCVEAKAEADARKARMHA